MTDEQLAEVTYTRDDRAALLEMIRERPDDLALRGVFADWLHDQCDWQRGEFIHVGLELARIGEPRKQFGYDEAGGRVMIFPHGPDYWEANLYCHAEQLLKSRIDVNALEAGKKIPRKMELHGLLVRKVLDADAGLVVLKRDALSVPFPKEQHAALIARRDELLRMHPINCSDCQLREIEQLVRGGESVVWPPKCDITNEQLWLADFGLAGVQGPECDVCDGHKAIVELTTPLGQVVCPKCRGTGYLSPVVEWHAGFPRRIAVGCAEWCGEPIKALGVGPGVRLGRTEGIAGRVMAACPMIKAVRLWDKRPVCVVERPHWSEEDGHPTSECRLPKALFDLLSGHSSQEQDARFYRTAATAFDALDLAAAELGRRAAKKLEAATA